ncbi:MAG: TPM domain-containing protein [Hyphomicrobiaceae bacterium]|nr:TPM domain-containing protein [Hyphomicrobiaceae bacterium]
MGLRSAGPRPAAPTMATAAVAFAAILIAIAAIALAAPTFPKLTGRVVDNANLIDTATEAALTSELAALEEKSTDQLVVVTLPSLQGYTIEDFGYQLGRHWAIGQKGKDNGILLIVAPNERKVRIEVGYGLGPQMTDALSRLIIENVILPRFRRGDFQGGIVAGVRDVRDVLLGDAEEVKKRAAGARRSEPPDYIGLLIMAIWISIFIYIVYVNFKQARNAGPGGGGPGSGGRRRRGFGDRVIVVPGNSGGWSGGGWSGGGGFGGGGGGFGGGGSSGGW